MNVIIKSFITFFILQVFIGCGIKPMEIDLGKNQFDNESPLNIDIKNISIEKNEKEVKFYNSGFGDSKMLIHVKNSTVNVVEEDIKEYFSKLIFNHNSNRTLSITIKEATPYWILSSIPIIDIFTVGKDTDYSLNLNVLFEIEENGKVINSYIYNDIITIKNSAAFEEDIKKGYQKVIKKYRSVFFNDLENKFIKKYL